MELNDYECVYQDVDRYLFENTEKGKLNVSWKYWNLHRM
jgi:hypothetical protein